MNVLRSSTLVLSCVFVVATQGCSSSPDDSQFNPTPSADLDNGNIDPGFGPSNPGIVAPNDVTSTPPCGNATLDPGETCDDGNGKGGDGCSAACVIEKGYDCKTVGAACTATACGDGIVAADEDCDDGNTKDGDGCSAVCTLEAGHKCDVAGQPCTTTTCGDGKKEGTEQCDDHNLRPYDGCSPTCTIEPTCAGGACSAACGDGVKFPGEECDDGNTRSGDGCSSDCKLEAGFTCEIVTSGLPSKIDIPIIYRDFTPATNPDFEKFSGNGATTSLVKSALGANGFPQFDSTNGDGQNNQQLTSAASFAAWWTENPAVEKTIFDKVLTLNKDDNDAYVFDDSSFFPIDGLGWGNYSDSGHNFHFTSELRYYFTYKGGEVLDFRGDDDVWVFVNGKLAVDLGGLHGATPGSVTLDAATNTAKGLGLTVGGMYELDLFQAERHTTESNYKLTLRGFEKKKTSCEAKCGDGVKTKYEACDDGTNAGGYGKCGPGCVLGARCGDGILQADQGEQCDDGNLVDGDGCSTTCKTQASNPK